MSETPPLAIYVHWPYCARICPYCDFNVVRERAQAEQPLLARAIAADLERQALLIEPHRLTSIFLGGGTPSLMNPDWAAEIIATARRLWPTSDPVEITLEANPTDAEAGRFAAFRDAGVERLSLGVQSFDDKALKFLGRNHSAGEARRAFDIAASVFPRVSIDLIYALPGQTDAQWRSALDEAVALGPEHISPYQLTVETGTALDRKVRRGAVKPLDPVASADLYETTQAVLEAAGYHAYEVSNHARGVAARSVHNLAYWRGWDYAGVGPGAHGRLMIEGERRATIGEYRVSEYLHSVGQSGVGWKTEEVMDPYEQAVERLLLGLRSDEGVPLAELVALEMDPKTVADMVEMGLLIMSDERLIATPAGRPVLDRITADLIP